MPDIKDAEIELVTEPRVEFVPPDRVRLVPGACRVVNADWSEFDRARVTIEVVLHQFTGLLDAMTDRLRVERGPGELVPVAGSATLYEWAPGAEPVDYRAIARRWAVLGVELPPRLSERLAERLAGAPHVVEARAE